MLAAIALVQTHPMGSDQGYRLTPKNTAALADRASALGLLPLPEQGRGVAPVFVTALPDDWPGTLSVDQRKDLFVATTLPLILAENRRLRRLREQLVAWQAEADELSTAQLNRLSVLAARYRLDEPDIDALLMRVDQVPVDLALSQAAIESGWGTSRFARRGNALFGQWTWEDDAGMTPQRRAAGKTHTVRRFETLRRSVAAYMRNLNSHPAYAGFRRERAAARAAGRRPSGDALAGTLTRYSERGRVYVDEIRTVLRFNDFDRLATATLADPGSI